MPRRTPRSTPTYTPFPYTTLLRSGLGSGLKRLELSFIFPRGGLLRFRGRFRLSLDPLPTFFVAAKHFPHLHLLALAFRKARRSWLGYSPSRTQSSCRRFSSLHRLGCIGLLTERCRECV